MHDALELFITVSIGLMLGLLIMWGPLAEIDKKELSQPKPEPESPPIPIPSAREYNASLLDDWDKRLFDAVIQDGGVLHGPFLPKDKKEEVVKARDVFMQAGAINNLFSTMYHPEMAQTATDAYIKYLYDSNPLAKHLVSDPFAQWVASVSPDTAVRMVTEKDYQPSDAFYRSYKLHMERKRI